MRLFHCDMSIGWKTFQGINYSSGKLLGKIIQGRNELTIKRVPGDRGNHFIFHDEPLNGHF